MSEQNKESDEHTMKGINVESEAVHETRIPHALIHKYIEVNATARWLLHNLPPDHIYCTEHLPDSPEFTILTKSDEVVGTLELNSYIIVDPIEGVSMVKPEPQPLMHLYTDSDAVTDWLNVNLQGTEYTYYKHSAGEHNPNDSFNIVKGSEVIGMLELNSFIVINLDGKVSILNTPLGI